MSTEDKKLGAIVVVRTCHNLLDERGFAVGSEFVGDLCRRIQWLIQTSSMGPKLKIENKELWDRCQELEARLTELSERASITYRILKCPKCGAEFEDNGKDYPSGVLCSACTGDVKGVIHPQVVKRFITQEQWNDVCKQRDRAIEMLEETKGDIEEIKAKLEDQQFNLWEHINGYDI